MINFNKTLFFILMAGLTVRIVLFFIFFNDPKFFFDDDSGTYINPAENIILGHGFSQNIKPPYAPDAFRTPGYPVFLMFHKLIFGNYYSALITQSLLGLIVASIAFLLAKEYFSSKIGYWTAAIFLVMPFSVQVNLKFLTQSFFAFILILAVWHWLRFLKNGLYWHLIITALLLPLLALIRPIAQFIYLPFFISFIYAGYVNNKLSIKNILKVGLTVGIIFFAVISPWLYRNYKVFGYFSLSSIISLQMYFYDAPAVYAYNYGISYPEAVDVLSKEAEKHFGSMPGEFSVLFSSGEFLKEKSIGVMLESPLSLVVVRGVQFFKFFIRDGIHYWFDMQLPSPAMSLSFFRVITPVVFFSILERSFLLLLFLGMIATLFFSFLDKNKEKKICIGFLLSVIFYFAALTGIMSSAGFRYPVEALFVLTGLAGLNKLRYG